MKILALASLFVATACIAQSEDCHDLNRQLATQTVQYQKVYNQYLNGTTPTLQDACNQLLPISKSVNGIAWQFQHQDCALDKTEFESFDRSLPSFVGQNFGGHNPSFTLSNLLDYLNSVGFCPVKIDLSGQGFVEVPLNKDKQSLYVKGEYGGERIALLLDTGWGTGSITRALAIKSKLPLGKSLLETDENHNTQTDYHIYVPNLKLDGKNGTANVRQFSGTTVSDDYFDPSEVAKHLVKGAIGSGMLESNVIKVDIDNGLLTIYDKDYFDANKGRLTAGFTELANSRYYNSNAAKKPTLFFVNVDVTGWPKISKPWAIDTGAEYSYAPVKTNSSCKWSHSQKEWECPVTLSLAPGVDIRALASKANGQDKGIGYPALKQLVWILDYPAQKAWVKPA